LYSIGNGILSTNYTDITSNLITIFVVILTCLLNKLMIYQQQTILILMLWLLWLLWLLLNSAFIWQTGFSEGPHCNPILATSSLYATASFIV
jgi:hypothetical protein